MRPVGSQREVAVDVRIISASHRDLNAEVERGHFRQDLFYRINVIELRMPTLRERPQDIPLLAAQVLERLTAPGAALGHGRPSTLSPEAVEALKRHPFPGNVRELENILERATALCDGEVIGVQDLYLTSSDTHSQPETPLDDNIPLEDYLGEIEKRAILNALDETHWNRTAAARKLGMTLRSLRYRLAKLGID